MLVFKHNINYITMFQLKSFEKIAANDNKNKIQEKIDTKIESKELSEDLIYLLGDLRFLKNIDNEKEDKENYQRRFKDLVENFSDFLIKNNAQARDINYIYRHYLSSSNKPLIVRREDPEKAARLIEGQDIDLSFDPKVVGDKKDKYANCAIWPHGKSSTAGMKNAYSEGRGMAGPFVTLIASRQNLEHNTIEKPINKEIRTDGVDRESVRVVSGKIKKEDLEFIVIRLQKEKCPEELLTEEEKKSNLKEIFRGFTFKDI